MNPEDFVLYRDDKNDGKIKSMGYEINSILPYINMPAMRGGGKIPGKKNDGKRLAVPVGLAVIGGAVLNHEQQSELLKAYIPQNEGVEMLPEDLHQQFFDNHNSNTNKRITKKLKKGGVRKTRKNKKH